MYGATLRPALYRACARLWGTGLVVISVRLSNTKELIQAAWPLRDSIAGVLIRKEELSFLPAYLSSDSVGVNSIRKSISLYFSYSEIKDGFLFNASFYKTDKSFFIMFHLQTMVNDLMAYIYCLSSVTVY